MKRVGPIFGLALGVGVMTGCLSFREHAPGDGGADMAVDRGVDMAADSQVEMPPPAGDAMVEAGSDASGQVLPSLPPCSADGWCWQSPLPQGNDLNSVWGLGSGPAWAVGEVGTILYWTGTRWAATPSGTLQALNGVWGTGANDAWAVGNAGTLLHWDGSTWRAFSSPTTSDLRAVWSSGPLDTWAVGANGAVLHWDGQWTAETPPTGGFPSNLTKVWGTSASDVWIGGPDGVLHYVSGTWSAPTTFPDTGVTMTALGGSGPDNVIAAGADQAGKIYVYRWHDAPPGGSWGRIYQTTGPAVASISALSTTSITAAGANLILSFDGMSWKTQFSTGIDLRGSWLAPAGDGWVVGKSGQVVRFDGTTWSEPPTDRHTTLTDVWPSLSAPAGSPDGGADGGTDGSSNDASDGSAGDAGPARTVPTIWISGFDPSAPAQHGGTVWRGQGGTWQPLSIGTVGPLWSIWTPDGSSLWAAGDALLAGNASGAPWTASGPAPYRRVRGTSSTSFWSVEKAVHFSNRATSWAQDGSQLWGLLVFDDYDVWASGESGAIFHWSPSPNVQWQTTPASSPAHALYALGGSSSKDVWAVGDMGTIRHWDGQHWSDVASGTTQPLRGIWVKSATEAWVVGAGGTILKWDGMHWAPSASGTSRLLYGVVADASGNLFAVGEQATILKRSP